MSEIKLVRLTTSLPVAYAQEFWVEREGRTIGILRELTRGGWVVYGGRRYQRIGRWTKRTRDEALGMLLDHSQLPAG